MGKFELARQPQPMYVVFVLTNTHALWKNTMFSFVFLMTFMFYFDLFYDYK